MVGHLVEELYRRRQRCLRVADALFEAGHVTQQEGHQRDGDLIAEIGRHVELADIATQRRNQFGGQLKPVQIAAYASRLALQNVVVPADDQSQEVAGRQRKLADGQRRQGREGGTDVLEQSSAIGSVKPEHGETGQVSEQLQGADEQLRGLRGHQLVRPAVAEVQLQLLQTGRSLRDDLKEIVRGRQVVGYAQLEDTVVEDTVEIGVEEVDHLGAVGREIHVLGQGAAAVLLVEAEQQFLAHRVVDDAHQTLREFFAQAGHDGGGRDLPARTVTDQRRVGHAVRPVLGAAGQWSPTGALDRKLEIVHQVVVHGRQGRVFETFRVQLESH